MIDIVLPADVGGKEFQGVRVHQLQYTDSASSGDIEWGRSGEHNN